MKFTLDAAQTIVSLNLKEASEKAKYDRRTSEYWPTIIGERLWFLNMLNNIEAEPIKHGRWICINGWVECSVCHQEPPNESNIESDYCPNCGAKMDEVENV